LVGRTDSLGHSWKFRCDAFGRVVQSIDPVGVAVGFDYDRRAQVTRIRWPNRTTSQLSYDAAGNLTRLLNELGQETVFRYGPCRRLLEQVKADGKKVEYRWDSEPQRLLEIRCHLLGS